MHEQLSSLEGVASIRTQEAEANPPVQADSPNAGEQRAIEQLRAIAQEIKACIYQTPDLPGLPDRMVKEGFKDVFGPPTNVIWDIETTQSIRSPHIGYVEYIVPAYMELPPTDSYCNARDIKKSECKSMWIIGTKLYQEQVVSPQQFRYEFDITPKGLEYSRGFEKKAQKEGEPWVEAASPDGCAARAIRSTQQSSVAVDTKQALALFDGKNYVEARPLLEQACDAGNAKACDDLGDIYDLGWGVAQDHSRSAALYLKACNAGNADGCLGLGISYGNGDGVERDFSRARELYSESCDKGNALGCAYLGDVYRNGFGVAQDYQRAVVLYTKSCETGLEFGYGCAALGGMYQNGYGVRKDLEKSKQLYDKACMLGNKDGCTLLKSAQ
jgi:TPR repeat protein